MNSAEGKPALVFVTAMVASLLIMVAPYIALQRACSLEASQQQRTENRPERSNDGGKQTQTQQANPGDGSAAGERVEPLKQKIQSPHPEYGAREKPGDWRRDFWCGVKATDVGIALFTFFLVLIGAWQGVQISQSVKVAKQSADALPALERGYVFAMPRLSWQRAAVRGGKKLGQPYPHYALAQCELINHGRTPVVLWQFEFDLRVLPSPTQPDNTGGDMKLLNFRAAIS